MNKKSVKKKDRVEEALSCLGNEIHELHQAITKNNQTVLKRMAELKGIIVATSKELAADLAEVSASQTKTLGEIAELQRQQTLSITRITELEAIISGGGVGTPITQELIDAVAAVKAQAQVVDDAIPDVATSGPL